MADDKKHNRQYKDRLFKLIFREKQDLLQLYNAVNGTNYDNPENIEVNTIEDAVYMGMKNDISFLVMDVLNLYEHQSTYNPNLPLRGLFYFADLYRKLMGNRRDIYSSRLIRLPFPQFVVFYNGTKEEPERQVLKLRDAFPEWSGGEAAALECQAVVLNINLGYNSVILEKCRKLKEYAQFIACVRTHLNGGLGIREATDAAVDECIRNGVLAELLRNNREEVCSMLLTEYDEEFHIKCEREIALEEGQKIGEEIGRKEGQKIGEEIGRKEGAALGETRLLTAMIRKKYAKGLTEAEIANALETDAGYVRQVIRLFEKFPKDDDAAIAEKLLAERTGETF